MPPVGRVQALWRYPVKSLLGESVARASCTARGFDGDRAFALVDPSDGAVVSAKHPRKWARTLSLSAAYAGPGALVGTAAAIRLPTGETVRTDAADVDAVLSAALGRPVRLVSVLPDQPVLERYWPEIDGLAPVAVMADQRALSLDPTEIVTRRRFGSQSPAGTFFDSSPVHLLTTSTLRRLQAGNDGGDADPRRLRPNLVLDTGTATGFAENEWLGRSLRLGEVVLEVTAPTARCVVPALAHGELPGDVGLVRAIARSNRLPVGDSGRYGCAGVYAEVVRPGIIRVGDAVSMD